MKVIESGYNPQTCGVYAFFEHNGNEYYADLCVLAYDLDGQTECMIFEAKDKQVTSWRGLYCKRAIPVTEEQLRRCIDEFINTL